MTAFRNARMSTRAEELQGHTGQALQAPLPTQPIRATVTSHMRAYKFISTNELIPLTIGDKTYSVELYSGFGCKASAVQELVGQTVTYSLNRTSHYY